MASRYRLIETMRADLLDAIHVHMERIFCDLLADGVLFFRLEGKGLSWEVVEKLTFEVTHPTDFQITHKVNERSRHGSRLASLSANVNCQDVTPPFMLFHRNR